MSRIAKPVQAGEVIDYVNIGANSISAGAVVPLG